jgi:peptidoglycan biosynthesis protein MviN/MurJ (putative lipid II flippase)
VPEFTAMDTQERDDFAILASFSMVVIFSIFASALVIYLSNGGRIPFLNSSGQGADLFERLMKIHLLVLPLQGVIGIITALANSKEKFTWSVVAAGCSSLLSLFILSSSVGKFGIDGAAYSYLVRIMSNFLFLLPFLKIRLISNYNWQLFKRVFIKVIPISGSSVISKSEIIVDRVILAGALPGTISIYNFGQQIYSALNQIITNLVATPNLSKLSALIANKQDVEFYEAAKKTLYQTAILALLAILIVNSAGMFFVKIYFEGTKFSGADLQLLSVVLFGLSGYMIFGALGHATSNFFYIFGLTRPLALVGVFGTLLSITMKIIFYRYFGFLGLCYASSLQLAINFALLLWRFRDVYKGKRQDA